MMSKPPVTQIIGKKIAAAGAAGLALVQANPVTAAVTVVVLVGITVYYLKNRKHKKKEDDLKYSHSGPEGRPKDEGGYFYDPVTKSVTDSPPTYDNFRKRPATQNGSTTKEDCGTSDDKKTNLPVSKGMRSETHGDSHTINDGNVLRDNSLTISMSGEEKVKEYILRHTFDTASEGSDDENNQSCSTNGSIYVKNVCDALNNLLSASDPQNQNNFVSEEVTDILSDTSVGTLLSGESDLCKACEVNQANAHMQPCNHRYVCGDCATKIVKLFKRCKVCRARIDGISLDAS